MKKVAMSKNVKDNIVIQAIKARLKKFFDSLEGTKPQEIEKINQSIDEDPYPYNNARLSHILGVFFDNRKDLVSDKYPKNIDKLLKYINERNILETPSNRIDDQPQEFAPKKPQGN